MISLLHCNVKLEDVPGNAREYTFIWQKGSQLNERDRIDKEIQKCKRESTCWVEHENKLHALPPFPCDTI